MSMEIRLPIDGLRKNGPVEAFTKAVLKGSGALVVLDVTFKPAAGPIPLVEPWNKVPIIGPFFQIRLLKITMNQNTRRLEAKVCYVGIPIKQDAQDKVIEALKLSPEAMKGEGYNLTEGVPLYSWQIFDLFLKAQEELSQKPPSASNDESTSTRLGYGDIRPRFAEGTIRVEGNFSNQDLTVEGVRFSFASLPATQKHRFEVSGKLLDPRISIYGWKEASVQNPRVAFQIKNNSQENLAPFHMQLHLDPEGQQPVRVEVDRYRSNNISFDIASFEDHRIKLHLELEEGIEVEGVKFILDPQAPRATIRKIVAKRIRLDGFGAHLETSPGDRAVLEDIRLDRVKDRPRFVARIEGRGSGSINYLIGNEELGYMKFRYLEGKGQLRIEPDEQGDTFVELNGNIATELPELRLLVRSEKMEGYVRTSITNASVSGNGRIVVTPKKNSAFVESQGTSNPITVRGLSGEVYVHQDPSEVEGWPELKRQLGARAADVRTDLYIQPREISFSVDFMNLQSMMHQKSGTPALEITDTRIGPIRIVGDLWGRVYTRIPGGFYYPMVIGMTEEDERQCRTRNASTCRYSAKMMDASVEVGRLLDHVDETGKRTVDFSQISISGVESAPTFSPRDQKRCGTDRQHIHATLGLFQFSPEDRSLTIEGVDPHFHIFLKDRLNGGCLKIE